RGHEGRRGGHRRRRDRGGLQALARAEDERRPARWQPAEEQDRDLDAEDREEIGPTREVHRVCARWTAGALSRDGREDRGLKCWNEDHLREREVRGVDVPEGAQRDGFARDEVHDEEEGIEEEESLHRLSAPAGCGTRPRRARASATARPLASARAERSSPRR